MSTFSLPRNPNRQDCDNAKNRCSVPPPATRWFVRSPLTAHFARPGSPRRRSPDRTDRRRSGILPGTSHIRPAQLFLAACARWLAGPSLWAMAGTLPEPTGDASRQPRSTAFLPEHIRVVGRMTRPPEQRPAHDTIDNIADWLLGSPRQLSDGIASFAWHLTQARPERRHSAGGYGSESRPWAKFQTGLHRYEGEASCR